MKKFEKIALTAAVLMASTASMAQISIKGDSSSSYVVAGGGNVPNMSAGNGRAGISMPRTSAIDPTLQSYVVSFAAGPITQTNNALNGAANYGNAFITYTMAGTTKLMSETWKAAGPHDVDIYAYRQISDPFTNFPFFGGEVFAKAPGQEVYWGEWAPPGNNRGTAHNTDLNMDDSRRTVFYVGENPTTSMPGLTNAKYDVVAIRKYNPGDQNGVYSATLTANYNVGSGSGTLTGTLAGVNFSGTNIASNGSFQNAGSIKGQFYGANADALAGMYNASGSANDFAFGGAKR